MGVSGGVNVVVDVADIAVVVAAVVSVDEWEKQ